MATSAIAIRIVPKVASTPVESDGMLERLRRRTMAPSRPLLYPEQVGLALFSLIAIGGGIYTVVKLLF